MKLGPVLTPFFYTHNNVNSEIKIQEIMIKLYLPMIFGS